MERYGDNGFSWFTVEETDQGWALFLNNQNGIHKRKGNFRKTKEDVQPGLDWHLDFKKRIGEALAGAMAKPSKRLEDGETVEGIFGHKGMKHERG